ncbi:dialkylrecorsinol condensing enzyme DarA [Maribacter sp. 2304DJ31-5]|uniref:dialkylrecorsinol condensing enzyme DarA n=1 Tax=Maribacter sp. 2304DJ31-5 TaxID=3386273 RepID=UPI0039BCA09B
MKEVLIIYYSQTGQLLTILENMAKKIEGDGIQISYYEIIPEPNYGFPWKQRGFYDSFPESFLQIPSGFKAPSPTVLKKKYDLVILGYQVWYLTPSIPVNSFLKSEYAKELLQDTPVVTVLACRNMWIQAQEKMKRLLKSAEAQLVGHIALVDRHINHISVITISHWMFSGRKDRYLGIFPKPGVSDKDIEDAKRFGTPIKEALLNTDYSGLQQKIIERKGVKINPFLVLTDKRGNVLFSKWANHIIKKGGPGEPERLKWIGFFRYYLLFAIWIIAPIVFVVFLLTYFPSYGKRKKEKAYYSSVVLNEN